MTVTGGTAQTRGLSDVSSCNATNSIEHLDWTPPCDSIKGPKSLAHKGTVPPAAWTFTTGCCGVVRLRCDACLAYLLSWPRLNCSLCCRGMETRALLMNLEPLR